MIPGCVSLDLSDNLFNSSDVLCLVHELPNLEELNLSSNVNIKLQGFNFKPRAKEIKLLLNSMKLTHDDLNSICN
jgi:hypothetical protein